MARATAYARPQFQNRHVLIQGQRTDQFGDGFLATHRRKFGAPQFLENLKPLWRPGAFVFGLFFFVFLVPVSLNWSVFGRPLPLPLPFFLDFLPPPPKTPLTRSNTDTFCEAMILRMRQLKPKKCWPDCGNAPGYGPILRLTVGK
jgi:hypothetical protein